MKKEFAVRTLNRIKEIITKIESLAKLGINLIEYEHNIDLLTESIALLFVKNDSHLEQALDDIEWWLYEKVEKKITVNKKVIDVHSAEQFIDWFSTHYD